MQHAFDEHLANNRYYDRHFQIDAAKILPGEYHLIFEKLSLCLAGFCRIERAAESPQITCLWRGEGRFFPIEAQRAHIFGKTMQHQSQGGIG